MNRVLLRILALLFAFSLVAAACGSDDDDDGGDATADDGGDAGDGDGGDGGAGAVNDVDFFYLPPVGDEHGSPMLTAGTFATAFNLDSDVVAALEYMAGPEYVETRLAADVGGFLSANSLVSSDQYPAPIEQAQVELLENSDVARYDGSDLMPGDVGSGSFWTAAVDIVTGAKEPAAAFADVQATWPDPAGNASECPAAEIGEGDGSITIFGPEVEGELEGFQDSFAPFTEATGIEVEINGDRSFSEQIGVQVDGGNPPDIAIFPQPGRIIDFARSCDLQQLPDSVVSIVNENFGTFADLGVVDGVVMGVPNKTDVKSLVWYSPSAFEAAGYAIPTTHDELVALMDTMVADGNTPLCIGIGSDAATGWPFTDWMEDYMLRLHGPDVYDQWINNEIPFDDPQVVEVAEFVMDIWSNEDYVRGGLQTIADTTFQDAGLPVLDGGCMMHRQANFYAANWPDGTQVGPAS